MNVFHETMKNCKIGFIEFLCGILCNGFNDAKRNSKLKPYISRRMKKPELNFSMIIEKYSDSLKILQISGTHCVTIWRKWIFDSNLKYALPLEMKLLLWCSNKEKESMDIEKFVISGFEITLPRHIKNKNKNNEW